MTSYDESFLVQMTTTKTSNNFNNGDDILSTSSYESEFNLSKDEEELIEIGMIDQGNERSLIIEADATPLLSSRDLNKSLDEEGELVGAKKETIETENSGIELDFEQNNKYGKENKSTDTIVEHITTGTKINDININNDCDQNEKKTNEIEINTQGKVSVSERLRSFQNICCVALFVILIPVSFYALKLQKRSSKGAEHYSETKQMVMLKFKPDISNLQIDSIYSNLTFSISDLKIPNNIVLNGKYIIDFDRNKMSPITNVNLFLEKTWGIIKENDVKFNNWLVDNYNVIKQQFKYGVISSNSTTT